MLRSLTGLTRSATSLRTMSTAVQPSWSRLVRFHPSSTPSSILIGEPVDTTLDVGVATYEGKDVEVDVYSGTSILQAGEKTGRKESIGTLLSPLAEEEVRYLRRLHRLLQQH
jgi:hypothetical protein